MPATQPHTDPAGPYDTEAQARATARPVYAAFDADPGVGKMAPHNHRMLCEALSAAGVDLGAYDHRIVLWLAGWEPQAIAVIAGLISRAHAAGRLRPARRDRYPRLSDAETATVIDALDVAADCKRDRAASCPDCDASPADLCGTCEWRLARADEYDALAGQLRSER